MCFSGDDFEKDAMSLHIVAKVESIVASRIKVVSLLRSGSLAA